jgi:putative ABC transport system ATP-binding protein
MAIAVKIEGLNKDFPVGDDTIRVLHDISAEIRMGELTMLVGPSGCGKTTLISIISGILSLTSGKIDLLGQGLNAMKGSQKVIFRRENIGFIFQQYNLLPALTAAENASIPLLAAGVSSAIATDKAGKILERIGMQGQTEKLPRQLSGGQQQRVAIARALVHNPKLIVCDEPTAALDAKTGQGVMEILREIANDKDRAVLVVTHDSRIYKFADRILEMSDGRIIGDHKPQDFIHKE